MQNKIKCPICQSENVMNTSTRWNNGRGKDDPYAFRCLNNDCQNPEPDKLFAVSPEAAVDSKK